MQKMLIVILTFFVLTVKPPDDDDYYVVCKILDITWVYLLILKHSFLGLFQLLYLYKPTNLIQHQFVC